MKVKQFYRQFGRRLKELRIQANLSQEELAERVGVSTKTVSYWENAHNPVTLSKIPIIASVLKKKRVFQSLHKLNFYKSMLKKMG